MTVTLLEMPLKPLKLKIPKVNAPAQPQVDKPHWFPLRPTAWATERALKEQYGIRYLWTTALTSKLQIQQMLLDNK